LDDLLRCDVAAAPPCRRLPGLGWALAVAFLAATCSGARADILVSGSNYAGFPGLITVGQALPGGGTAVADGSYPNVFNNAGPDPSFGVTSPIFISHLTNSGTPLYTFNLPTSMAVTSFTSKSELAINLSTNGQVVTFMGYVAPVNTLDVSNSNTPGHVDPTNPVTSSYQRAVIQVDKFGNVQVTPVNAYSGNNGRAAILANGQYYSVDNAGNGSGTQPTFIVNNTGVQLSTPGVNGSDSVVGKQQGTMGAANGFQYGYSVVQNGYTADKSGKDDNFRGLTIFGNTLYVTKGSGSNGVNTVYQVGIAGTLPTAGTAAGTTITILPGFPTGLARNTTPPLPAHPFGIWFASATTLYVGDEGDGVLGNAATSGGGLQKWTFDGTSWNLQYTLTSGLNLGAKYGVAGYPVALDPATDGLRNIIGQVNGDGTVTIWAVTSTISTSGDQGADPNMVVSISDLLSATSLPTTEHFNVVDAPAYGMVYRGVAVVPQDFLVPEPSTLMLFGLGSTGLAAWRWRRRRAG
jgi:PEP-CTERM motif